MRFHNYAALDLRMVRTDKCACERRDKFAESALTFKNAYIQYSFCCPSRNSFMVYTTNSATSLASVVPVIASVSAS